MDGGPDGRTGRREPSSDVEGGPAIILEDWLSESQPETRTPEPGLRRPFGARSPLARKIISFNLVALGALVIGVLYFNQFRDGLLLLRERALMTEASMIASALASPMANPRSVLDRTHAERTLRLLAFASENQAQIYGVGGALLADSFVLRSGGDPAPVVIQPEPNDTDQNLFFRLADEVSRRFRGLVVSQEPITGPDTLPIVLGNDTLVARALKGEVVAARKSNLQGQTIVSVALPVQNAQAILGTIVMSTRGGEIDVIVRAERAQIMQVFSVALIISITLSLVLANTIARPIQRLAEAAEIGGARDSRLVNPRRIRIPDMSGRPDEIGYLSSAMRAMTQALYDRIEAIEAFAADVSHEIKNPLTSLRSAVETMRYAKDDNARSRLIDVIEMDVNRLDRLVTDISNASRLDGELVREEMDSFSMTELLRNLVEFNAPKARQNGGTLIAELPSSPLITQGLEGRLAQVFVNLITNAISFTDDGGIVKVSALRMPDNAIRVEVVDTGPGIPDDNLGDVFNRFYSERPGKSFGDHSGLGLSISLQIIDAHGGRIWAENVREDGASTETSPLGARFVVELPQ